MESNESALFGRSKKRFEDRKQRLSSESFQETRRVGEDCDVEQLNQVAISHFQLHAETLVVPAIHILYSTGTCTVYSENTQCIVSVV